MNVLLILLGIYVYFVAGNLVCKLYRVMIDKKLLYEEICPDYPIVGVIVFPVALLIMVLGLIINLVPKLNIPFTPKKVADLICSIRIERKAEKPGNLQIDAELEKRILDRYEKPDCFGKEYGNTEYEYRCTHCGFDHDCFNEFYEEKK